MGPPSGSTPWILLELSDMEEITFDSPTFKRFQNKFEYKEKFPIELDFIKMLQTLPEN